MNLNDLLIRHQNVLSGAQLFPGPHLLPGEMFIAGQFGGRATQLGVRRALKNNRKREVFLKVRINQSLGLPLQLQEICPIKAGGGSVLRDADLRIEDGQWLTERVRILGGAETYFASQTSETVRVRLMELAQLAGQIETGEFSVEKYIKDLVRKVERGFFVMLGMALGVVIFCVLVVMASLMHVRWQDFFGSRSHVQSQSIGSSKASITRVAREQAAYGFRERRIIPSNSNVFLDVVADQSVVSLGKRVVLTYTMFTCYDTRYWGLYNEGRFPGFRVEHKTGNQGLVSETIRYKGRKFLKVTVGKAYLFPKKPGRQMVYPGSAFVSTRRENGAIMDVYLNTRPVEITVQTAMNEGR